MKITVNGNIVEIEDGTTLDRLLADRNVKPKYCAVERNKELVPRATHADCTLEEGDVLEIVTLVGGG